ncbi:MULTISPECIES: hypothetical protein [unclassified Ectothiorhodospira]|uniref:hypothetical protein n=1 Tax=unclassified Ectothiorhodospira TaxID=2684909 RepID=UPI001EE8431E|nr:MULTISPECIES: hypothetical protein [unclassified Ectothiorhodospira]MCG5516064.1 hypothetical protein [Ectothiorhodospira sp. 9100]MCG5519126.1 hypothetical protein [Ectothiorhodospira sp. 9905]
MRWPKCCSTPVGRWVLRQACLQARQWAQQGLEFGTIAVNVSGVQVQTVADVLQEGGLDSSLLDMGCHRAQGYLFSRPVPAEDIPAILNARRRAHSRW